MEGAMLERRGADGLAGEVFDADCCSGCGSPGSGGSCCPSPTIAGREGGCLDKGDGTLARGLCNGCGCCGVEGGLEVCVGVEGGLCCFRFRASAFSFSMRASNVGSSERGSKNFCVPGLEVGDKD